MQGFLLALVATFAESGVRFVEDRFSGAPGQSKRAAAFKYVADRLHTLQRILGPFGGIVSDSQVLGVIDGTVESLHASGEFGPHVTEVRAYSNAPIPTAFQWTDPATGLTSWKRINNTTGILEPARTIPDPQNPMKQIPDPADEARIAAGGANSAGATGEQPLGRHKLQPAGKEVLPIKTGAVSDGLLNVLNRRA